MRTTIDLPDSLFRQIKARAALEGSTLKEYVIARLRHDLEVAQPAPTEERWQTWLAGWKSSRRDLEKGLSGKKKASAILAGERNRL